MNKLTKIGLVLGGIFAAGYFVWQKAVDYYIPQSILYYRLDVTFDVDGVPVTGSAVQKLVVTRVRNPLSEFKADWDVRGEAVIVDLPRYGSVFVLMIGSHWVDYQIDGFPGLIYYSCNVEQKREALGLGDDAASWDNYVRMIGELSGACAVPQDTMPTMVVFEDEADPLSVKQITPSTIEEVLGADVHFAGASVTITDGPVTTGIKERLPWLLDFSGPRLASDQPPTDNKLAQILEHYFFWRH